ncbi:hypothetical protein [Streptomyces sp. NPDC039028]|uniref:hypothetical protein n=1 Tax=Streptomyces sp. NPDC039028 TaxID=3155370 RepID=UPI0033C61838
MEVGQVALRLGQQAPQLDGGELDHRAVGPVHVDGQPHRVADALRERRGVVAEAGPPVPVQDLEPVEPLVQPVAAAGHERHAGRGVGDPQPPGREEVLHGQQSVEEAAQRIGRAPRVVLVRRIDVVALGDAHHRRTDLLRTEPAAERQEGVRPRVRDRPEVEVVRAEDLQDGMNDDHPTSVRH